MKNDRFIQGVVSALDVVAHYDAGVIFKEIVQTNGVKDTLKEIKRNGLSLTKKLAKSEFPNDYP